MEPIIFVYSFTIEGYDVIVTIEFFFSPHVIVLEDPSPEPVDDNFENVDTFFNL